MRLLVIFLLLILTSNLNAISQTDTTTAYYGKDWKQCKKDSAMYISKVYQGEGMWHRKDYWIKSMKLQSDEAFLDNTLKRPVGTSFYYNENGIVTQTQFYENERQVKALYYFDNGNKKAIVLYDESGKIKQQTGWEEDGTEIADYIYEQEAYFPEGPEGWREFLISKININTAAKAKAPVGMYTVKVQFIINKEGKVERAEAISVPPACKKCGEEAVKIINSSPRWQHAIQYGRPVIYQAIQSISWQVE